MDTIEASLWLQHGPQPNLRHNLEKEQTTIGRSAGNELVLVDPEVSRRHARVVRKSGYFAIEDLGSTNGTFVNGQRINRLTALAHGDIIDLGDTVRLRYEITGPVEAPGGTSGIVAPAQPQATGPVPAPQPAAAAQPASAPAAKPAPVAAATSQPAARPGTPPPPPAKRSGMQTFLLGCGFLVALIFACALTFAILDTYQQGRLLYCGPIRPVFEFLLGPFGFAPLCP